MEVAGISGRTSLVGDLGPAFGGGSGGAGEFRRGGELHVHLFSGNA
jgi:hypothetical protein